MKMANLCLRVGAVRSSAVSFFFILGLLLTAAVYYRAALEIAFLSAVTDLIGITNLSSCTSPPTEIYRMLAAVIFIQKC
jgi:hypothetical protein